MSFFWYIATAVAFTLSQCLAYNMVFGKGKILFFGSIGQGIVSAYSFGIVYLQTGNIVPAIVASLACTSIISLLFTVLALRLEPDGFGILSIAIHLAALAVVLNWTSLTRGSLGLPGIPSIPGIHGPVQYAIFGCTLAGLFAVLVWFLDRGKFGRALMALSEQQWQAQSLGISRAKVYAVVFLVLGLSEVIGNILYIEYTHLIHPNDAQFNSLILFLMIVVAGKPGSFYGTIVSTVGVICLREGLRFLPLPLQYIGPVRLLLFGIILLAAVWFRRKELFPIQRSI